METPLRQIRLTDFPCAFFRFRAPHRQEQGSRVCFSAPRCVSSRTRAESRKKSNGTDEGFLTRRFFPTAYPGANLFDRLSDRTRGGFATRDAQTRARWRETPPREYRYVASLAPDRPRRCGRRGGRSTATPTFPCVPPRAARVSSMSGCVTFSLKRRVTDSAVRAARGRSLGTIDANGTSPGRSHVSFARAGTASRAP